MNVRDVPVAVRIAAFVLIAAAPACTALVDWDSIHEDNPAPASTNDPGREGGAPSGSYVDLVTTAKPIAWFHLDEPSGDVAIDAIGGPSGTLRGGTSRVPGAAGGGASLDGIDGRLDLGDRFAFVEDAARSWSFEIVVRIDRVDSDYARIFSREGRSSGDVTGVFLFSQRSNIGFARSPGPGGTPMGTYTSGPAATGRFLHIVTTCDGTSCRLYVDGTLVGGDGAKVGSSAPAGVARVFMVGGAALGANALRGIIDEVAFYDRALRADDVLAHRRALP